MMESLIADFPSQLEKALAIGKSLAKQTPKNELRNIVIAGMGGSGIGANIVENIINQEIKLPIQIIKSYYLPASVGKHTLFIACSFSGNTEETLTTLALAEERGANVFAITAGGKLLEIAQQKGYPYLQMPNEAPCPRAFLGYSLTQLFFALHAYDLIGNSFERSIEATIVFFRDNQAQIRNNAKELAKKLGDKQIIAYADQKFEPLLLRLQQQINENAKQLCHINTVPEMNHNELVGWDKDKAHYQNIVVLWVRHHREHARIIKRMQIIQELINPKAGQVEVLHASGVNITEQSLSLIHFFDWLSFYLAEQNGVDAFAIAPIIHLKDELAKI